MTTDWIKWNGVGPTPAGVVRVKYRDGVELSWPLPSPGLVAGTHYRSQWTAWGHTLPNSDSDIVAYKQRLTMLDGWVDWLGEYAPPREPVARVRFRDGQEEEFQPGRRWDHIDSPNDIVAYKPQAAGATDGLGVSPQQRLTGGPSDYYTVHVAKPMREDRPAYTAECADIIEALNMTFNEGECFKALWRSCSARTLGKGKPGTDALYDGEKVAHYGQRVLAQRKS